VPSKDEIELLCAHWDANERVKMPLSDFIRFAASSGMRREEIARLRWEDLDAEAGVILVRDRKDPRKKAGNHQRVPLMFESLSIIQRQPKPEGAERIFPIKAESISTLFARACNALKIVDLRFHDLRHGAITRMFRSGMKIEEVAVVSGHRTWTQLKRYTHLRAEDLAEKYRPAERPATDPAPPDDRTPSDQP
jgi:integrase